MKAILIDSTNQSVSEVQFDGELKSIYSYLNCSCFDVVRLGSVGGKSQIGYVDDEGLYSQEFGFSFNGNIFAGNMLIVSDDGEGGNESTTIKSSMLFKLIRFITKDEFPEPKITVTSFGGDRFSSGGNAENN